MSSSEPVSEETEPMHVNAAPRKPQILLAASGSVAGIKFGNLCHCFSEWAEVRAVATTASLHFIDRASLPKDVVLYTDDDEWSSWKKIGDNVLHIELRRWADIMVIAPLSANTLGKVIRLRNFRKIVTKMVTRLKIEVNQLFCYYANIHN
ncbi:phosphopantothenoylcysteine decarboxylase-like [Quercus lobata]|uniref:phosphopantothenoylcysteine decarboxylase-like n=1 Tax=Quercus lobata TaxID=97700 RepID=UPI0012473CC6|nr:phosphopantothenoylcysteine decarboxylase-like [Quercus lobata]